MLASVTATVKPSHGLVDTLWERYRAIAEKTLTAVRIDVGEKERRALRGAMLLFVADCVARWIDRLEREPDAGRRRAQIELLLMEE
jgi:hypothetical protein